VTKTLYGVLFSAVSLLNAAPTYAADNPLASLADSYRKQPHTATAPVSVSATAAIEKGKVVLRFRLTNTSKETLAFDPSDLPWGNVYSISWAAITREGDVLPLQYPIQDNFGMGPEVSIRPGEMVAGTYELSWMLPAAKVPPDSDLVILWLYDVPPRPVTGKVTEPKPICTGVAFVRTPKQKP
jgi:hypothetical protein